MVLTIIRIFNRPEAGVTVTSSSRWWDYRPGGRCYRNATVLGGDEKNRSGGRGYRKTIVPMVRIPARGRGYFVVVLMLVISIIAETVFGKCFSTNSFIF